MKNRILISGIYADSCGLGNIINNLVPRLSAHFEVTCLAFTPAGNLSDHLPELPEAIVHHVQFMNNQCMLPEKSEVYENIKNHVYASIITLGPIHLNAHLISQLRELNSRMQIISFVPYEGRVINTLDASTLNKIDDGVFYSKFTYDCYSDLVIYENIIDDYTNKFSYVYQGVNTEKFYPLSTNREEKKRMARSKIAEYRSLPEDAFIILNANKPNYRSGLDSTLTAFKEFSAQREDCYLHLHLGCISNTWYKHIQSKIQTYGLGNRVITTYTHYPNQVHTAAWLNHVYNACDVGLSTSYGEGWGLGIFEHAATGAPIIVPNHTIFKEHWEHVGLLTDICDTKYLEAENTEIYIPSKKSIIEALKKLYDSTTVYNEYAKKCFTHATSSTYSWDKTAAFFTRLLMKKEMNQPVVNMIAC
jgi:hypothetical protein